MAEIQLTQSRVALIDDADLPLVLGRSWRAQKSGNKWYARSGGRRSRTVYMHRLILGLKPAERDVDHINGDGLDNRRRNLRRATRSQNSANSSGHRDRKSRYKGVYCQYPPSMKSRGLWCAQLMAVDKTFCRSAPTEIEAAVEYNKMALTHVGEFAHLNAVPCSWGERV